jgi:putative tricarboxylic transport membrane protein
MDLLHNLALGFGVALTLQNLLYCLIGVSLGTLVGVLPGIGPVATIAMLLPASFSLPPVTALILLAGIYYGAQYGGSTTAILVNLPGESSSVVTCIDGYQMARQGRAGPALSIAALGSFFAGCVGTLILAAFAQPLSELAVALGPIEKFSLMVLGLVAAVALAHGSLVKALGMILVGLLLGTVGADTQTGHMRYTFGIPELTDGIGFVVVAMGLFGFGEIIANLEKGETREVFTSNVKGLFPRGPDLKAAWKAVVRGTGVGALLGILPGGGAVLGSFAAYAVEKRIANDPSRFGKGAIEGVAAPESANNAGAQTSFITLLSLGIPSNAVMALMIGAMVIKGITPGPQVMTEQPELVWGMIASMWIGNLMLVILNLPLIGIWIKLLTIPYRLLFPAILVLCCIGIYSLNNSATEVGLAAGFGLLGYVFIKLGCEPAPLLLAMVLGPMMEDELRRGMTIHRGDPTVFLKSPFSLVMLVLAAALLVVVVVPAVRRQREEAFQES